MATSDLCFLPVIEVAPLLRRHKLSPVELVRAYLRQIDAVEGALNAFITATGNAALLAARQAEQAIHRGEYLGPLHGVPIALKDLFQTRGVRTTSGSKVMADHVPSTDCTVAAKLQEAGAILIGKTNMNELALGAAGDNPHYGDSANPWDPSRISGGSSGGSAAAVAGGECAAALGSDTGGSVRIPAALCGVVGLKPAYGRVSLNGVTPLAWSLDHVGVMARRAADCALLLNTIAGADPRDPASLDLPVPDFAAGLEDGVRSFRIGVPMEHVWDVVSADVVERVRLALEVLEDLGAVVDDVSIPLLSTSIEVSSTILSAEAVVAQGGMLSAHGAALDPRVKGRLEAGLGVSAADYIRASRARAALRYQVRESLGRFDLLAMPTCAIAAPARGVDEMTLGGARVSVLAALTRLTRLSNLTGFPSATVPCGFSDDGLPIGLQLIGRPLDEATVLRAAHAYEHAVEWRLRRPQLGEGPGGDH